jgi:hypothetical protein
VECFLKNFLSVGSVDNEEILLCGIVFGVYSVSYFVCGRGREDRRVDADSELAALESGWSQYEGAA